MSAGKYEKDSPLSDLIPIEGVFISAFLGNMPPLFVKVYIYLLYLCRHGELKIDTIKQRGKCRRLYRKRILRGSGIFKSAFSDKLHLTSFHL